LCTHRGVVRLFYEQNYVAISDDSVFLHAAPITFDAATFEIWGALLSGGTCVLANEKLLNSSVINSAIKNDGVNVIFLTTALFNVLVDLDVKCFDGLQQLLTGGDVISISHVKKLYSANNDINIINVYGPTENTTFTTSYYIPRNILTDLSLSLPIGKPINHTQVYILDENLNLVNQGEEGELYIGGDGLAEGYLNQEDLTKSYFLDNPFNLKCKLYKSGDLVRLNDDGNIEFLGRKDLQAKVNGFRVELGEIENCINSYKDIKTSAVVTHGLPTGGKSIVAFIIGDHRDEAGLRNYLSELLPKYSQPNKLIWRESLPITTSGKIDRKILQEESKDRQNTHSSNLNEAQEKLAAIWSSILKVSVTQEHDNFFYLGGDSLSLLTLDKLIYENYQVHINLKEFYRDPTVKNCKVLS
jgi:acyl-coenzyme A synthetase/AMP-(fatty) acid ligase